MSRHFAVHRPVHGLTCTLAGLFLVALAPLQAQSTYVVDSTGDGGDTDVGDGVCADVGGACTLRAAIEQANETAGLDEIHFYIPGDGPHTIALTSTLPTITYPVVIDGYTQPGSSANTGAFHEGTNAVFMVVLDAGGTTGDGFRIQAGGSTVRGLRIENAPDVAIWIHDSGGNTIEGNLIVPQGFAYGVYIQASDNRIGGTTPAARNVIGGGATGVRVASGSDNLIQGNLIGTDAAGTGTNGNVVAGVHIQSPGNTIGGDVPGAGNVISANETGIYVDYVSVGETVIQGNLVGTDVTGTVGLGNVEDGMFLRGTPMRIGGTAAAARNVVSGNSDNGIELADDASDVVIEGNYIGVDITGAAAIPNFWNGLFLRNDGHTVGGTAAGAGNVISGNGNAGIFLNARNSTIQGNRIGTDATGTEPIPNQYGIQIIHASSNLIGGTEDGAGNVLAASTAYGMVIEGSSSDNLVQGNFIGTDASGALDLGNGVPANVGGVRVGIDPDEQGNRIEGNVIAFSGRGGVEIAGGTGNPVSGNRIFSNAGLGINLGPAGVTPNDPGDADTGPNNLQNFPIPTLAYLDGGTVVEGTLNSAAGTGFTLEFFASEACDPSDHGEGAVFLGSAMVTTDGAGDASFVETLPTAAEVGEVVAATATDPAGNTSEFSTCVRVGSEPTFVVTAADDTNDGECTESHCSLREAIVAANAHAGADRIHFDIPGEGPHVTVTREVLPVITDPVVIDGYTQPGASANTNGPDQGTNAAVMIELSTDGGHGLEIEATSTVRGLRIIGATSAGIALTPGSDGSTIEGNSIQPDPAAYGIEIHSPDNVIGGTEPAARNVIGGGHVGIRIEAGGANTLVQGNLIGTDAAGTGSNGNAVFGISALGHATVIGGTSPGAGNVVSANAVGIAIATADSVLVQGNRVGTDVTGTAALGNTAAGISATSGAHHRFDGNLVSGNDQKGISIATDSVLVTGNQVGVDVGGTGALPNGDGVRVETEGGASTIGGTSAEAGNLIAFNTDNGVVVTGSGATILGNAIHSNGGLGIDLGDDGVTENDEGDTDTGPSGYQNFPAIALALTGSAELEGTFGGAADATFTLEFFSSDECSATGHGEGQRFLGATAVTTDGSGDGTFAASLDGPAAPGDAVTATATDADGNTSEFSACATGVGYDVAATATEGTVARGQDASYDVTVTAIAGTFDREVTLSCDGLPAGAACAFTPATVQPGATSATSALVVTTINPETPTGTSDFEIQASFGSIQRTDAATLTVTDFTIAAAPEQVTVTGGEDATFTVTVAPDGPGFGEAVSLACSELPAGASCSFAPAEVTPGSDAATATLTVSTVPLTAGSPAARVDWTPRGRVPGVPAALALLVLATAVLLGSRRRLPRRLTPVVAVLALVALAGLACGGDDPAGPDPEPDPDPVTTTFTITGTSGELEHATTAMVRVE